MNLLHLVSKFQMVRTSSNQRIQHYRSKIIHVVTLSIGNEIFEGVVINDEMRLFFPNAIETKGRIGFP